MPLPCCDAAGDLLLHDLLFNSPDDWISSGPQPPLPPPQGASQGAGAGGGPLPPGLLAGLGSPGASAQELAQVQAVDDMISRMIQAGN